MDTWCKFFILFSKFECALKRTGFLQSLDEGQNAQASIDNFLNTTLPADFYEHCLNDTTIKPLLNHQPKKQIVKGGQLSWKEEHIQIDDNIKLRAVLCRLRNNLFHGGKYPNAFQDEVARDHKLLDAGIALINSMVKQSSSGKIKKIMNSSPS